MHAPVPPGLQVRVRHIGHIGPVIFFDMQLNIIEWLFLDRRIRGIDMSVSKG